MDENVADQDILVALLTEGLIAMPEEEETDGAEAAMKEMTVETEAVEEAAEEQASAEEAEPSEETESTEAQETETPVEKSAEQGQEAETPAEETEEPIVLHISFPAEKHSGVSLRNLVYLLYSRAELINKATGSHFRVDDGLIEALNGVLVEQSDVEVEHFALLFEFNGDQHKTRHVLYNCTCSRPTIESATTEDTKEPQTDTLSLTALPLANGYVKAKTALNTA